ncbi:MAG: hypothetical protein KJ725_08360 [Gammaproteobacteria bacterium]|nr:hypothetical protein [Gammaproteobacteria bacterium]
MSARLESRRRAGKKYQSTHSGRFHNADRQQRFQERQKQKVTHQGSLQVTAHDVLKRKHSGLEKTETIEFMGGDLRCHHCGAVCGPFLRRDFVHAGRNLPLFRNRYAGEGG